MHFIPKPQVNDIIQLQVMKNTNILKHTVILILIQNLQFYSPPNLHVLKKGLWWEHNKNKQMFMNTTPIP